MEYQATFDAYNFGFIWTNFRNKSARDTIIPEFICPTAPMVGDRISENQGLPATHPMQHRGAYLDYAVNGRVSPSTTKLLTNNCTGTGPGAVKNRPDWQAFFTGVEEYKCYDPDGCPPEIIPPGILMKQTGRTTLQMVTDGTSHTIMYSPDAGRPDKYQDGIKIDGAFPVSGARWADPDQEFWTHNICAGATSIMNCNNDNEIYSFHVGGGLFSLGDGSVQFLTDTLDIEVQLSFTTRAGEDFVESVQ
jgi:hypothetical protein